MKHKILILLLICFFGNVKVCAQKLMSIDSCSLRHLVKNSENLNLSHFMNFKNVSKKIKLLKTVENVTSKTCSYSSIYGNFEINYDENSICLKSKNEKAILNFNYKFTYKLIGVKMEKQLISFIIKSEFSNICKPYISFDFYYDKNKKFKSVSFTQWDYVDGK